MAGHTTIKKDGGWTIELVSPIEDLTEISIRPASLEHTLRWEDRRIPSVLALLAELSGVREATLRRLQGQDATRVLEAFFKCVPDGVRQDFNGKVVPLASSFEDMTPEQQYETRVEDVDAIDPRFPRVDGDVVRVAPRPPEPEPKPDNGGLVMEQPTIMKRVG